MYNGSVKDKIAKQINSMMPDLEKIVDSAVSSEMAVQNIMSFVSSKVTAMSRGWLLTEYRELSDMTLAEPIFQTPVNANKFYALELETKIMDAYKLEMDSLNSFKEGLTVHEVNKLYASAGAAVGAGAVGGILLGVLSGAVDIPFVVIIAGAVVCALVGAGVAYTKVIPNANKTRYKENLKKFSDELINDLCIWVDSIADFYEKEVSTLKSSL